MDYKRIIDRLFRKIFDFRVRYNIFTRNQKINEFLIGGVQRDGNDYTDYKNSTNNYGELADKLTTKYKEIRLIWNGHSNRIGEFIPRCSIAKFLDEQNPTILYLMVVHENDECNKKLIKILTNNFYVCSDGEDLKKWTYIVNRFKRINIRFYDELNKARFEYRYDVTKINNKDLFKLTNEELEYGKRKQVELRIEREFVCIANRDSGYLRETYVNSSNFHNYRDSSIKTRKLAIQYLNDNGFTTVRMGKIVNEEVHYQGCVDYASLGYDEFMDVFFATKCKMFISDLSGVATIAAAMGKPIVWTNGCGFLGNCFGGLPINYEDIMIMKKPIWNSTGKTLSSIEVIENNVLDLIGSEKLDELGVRLVENTAEEIFEAVKERLLRINNQWFSNRNDEELQNKYREFVEIYCNKNKLDIRMIVPARVGTAFLRDNKAWLTLS